MAGKTKNLINRNGTWYLRAMVDGKRYLRSLGTPNKTEARAIANRFLKALQKDRFEILDQTKAKKGYPTIGVVVDAYCRCAEFRDVRARTVQCNVNSLQLIVRRGLGLSNGADVRGQSTDILDRNLVASYVRSAQADCTDEMGLARRRRTARSTLNQARRVFARWAIEATGLSLPPALEREFMKVEGAPPAPVKYQLPDQQLRDRTLLAGRALRAADPDLYIAFLLTYDLALRAGEARAVRWSWFRMGPRGRVLDIADRDEFRVKGRGSVRTIPVSEQLWQHIRAAGNMAGEYVLPGGTKTDRSKLVDRRLANWMRAQGWSGDRYPKAAHELRKLQGSRWFTELGAEVAQAWLGHSDIATTCRFYAALTRQPAALPMDGITDSGPVLALAPAIGE